MKKKTIKAAAQEGAGTDRRDLVRGEKARNDAACNILGELRAAGLMVALSTPEMLEGNMTETCTPASKRQQAAGKQRWDEACARQEKAFGDSRSLAPFRVRLTTPSWSWPPLTTHDSSDTVQGRAEAGPGQVQAKQGAGECVWAVEVA